MIYLVLFFLIAIALIGHGYIWIGPINRLHAWAGPRIAVDQLTNVCLLAFLALPALVVWNLWNLDPQQRVQYWKLSGFFPRYAQLCVVWGIGKLIYDWFDQRKVDSPQNLLSWQKRAVKPTEPIEVHGLYSQLLAAVPGNQILQLSIDEKRLAIPELPSQLENFRLAHISDIHMTGRIGKRWFEIVTQEVNQLEADAIVITGDIVENKACWNWLEDTLGKLYAKYGVYFILGNHDYFIDPHKTRNLLRKKGLVCLSESNCETQWNGCQVILSGNEHPWGSDSLAGKSFSEIYAEEAFHLSLIHTPDQFLWTCSQRANLVVAGHTHGGQIRLPILGAVACPSLYGTHYACGVFKKNNTVMHVSRGISGETPIRWNCPPEIALLELSKA